MTTIDHPKMPTTGLNSPIKLTTYETMNSAPSNYKWSFGQDNRFPKVKKTIDKISYDLPTTKTKRSAGFGIGDRFKTVTKEPLINRSKFLIKQYLMNFLF